MDVIAHNTCDRVKKLFQEEVDELLHNLAIILDGEDDTVNFETLKEDLLLYAHNKGKINTLIVKNIMQYGTYLTPNLAEEINALTEGTDDDTTLWGAVSRSHMAIYILREMAQALGMKKEHKLYSVWYTKTIIL